MARTLNKITDRKLRTEMNTGHHADGGGLYIRVKKSGAKSWAFRWKQSGRVREIGLGGYPNVSLAVARKLGDEHRATLAMGEVPKSKRQNETNTSFSEVVEQFLDVMESHWSNTKHRQQWRNTLDQYCSKTSAKPVSEIDLRDILAVLTPIKDAESTRGKSSFQSVLTNNSFDSIFQLLC